MIHRRTHTMDHGGTCLAEVNNSVRSYDGNVLNGDAFCRMQVAILVGPKTQHRQGRVAVPEASIPTAKDLAANERAINSNSTCMIGDMLRTALKILTDSMIQPQCEEAARTLRNAPPCAARSMMIYIYEECSVGEWMITPCPS